MPRNSSGSMSPANGPYISGTTISSVAVNARFADIETEITSSLDRTGRGGMTAPLRTADGSVAAPAHSFTSEPATGFYKSAAGEIAVALGGVLASKLTAFGMAVYGSARAFLESTAVNSVVQILGNRNATDTGADVELNGQVTRTAGLLVQINNNSVPKLNVDYQGLLQLASQAAAIQPASIWTAITPNTSWTAGNGLAYWKDAGGMVHLKGSVTFATGAISTAFTLPAGFRPAFARTFYVPGATSFAEIFFVLSTAGDMFNTAAVNGHTYNFDSVSFLAEA